MVTIGHHTCANKNDKTYILQNAPFRSEFNKERNKIPFLGGGYYFWDNNLEAARYWGENHYKGNYCIYECVLNIDDNKFLDLVGSRDDMIKLRQLIDKFSRKIGGENLSLGEILEYFKQLNNLDPTFFDITIVRAIDSSKSKTEADVFRFSDGKNNYTDLNPRLIICFYTKKPLYFKSPKIIFP